MRLVMRYFADSNEHSPVIMEGGQLSEERKCGNANSEQGNCLLNDNIYGATKQGVSFLNYVGIVGAIKGWNVYLDLTQMVGYLLLNT